MDHSRRALALLPKPPTQGLPHRVLVPPQFCLLRKVWCTLRFVSQGCSSVCQCLGGLSAVSLPGRSLLRFSFHCVLWIFLDSLHCAPSLTLNHLEEKSMHSAALRVRQKASRGFWPGLCWCRNDETQF